MRNSCDQAVDDFLISCNKIPDQYATRKKKYVRGSHSPFMSKNFSKAIMLRTKLGLRKIKLDTRNKEICPEHFCEKVRENILIT